LLIVVVKVDPDALLLLLLLLFTPPPPDVFITKRELLKCEIGIDADDDDLACFITFVSDNDNNFLTASGECVPVLKNKK